MKKCFHVFSLSRPSAETKIDEMLINSLLSKAARDVQNEGTKIALENNRTSYFLILFGWANKDENVRGVENKQDDWRIRVCMGMTASADYIQVSLFSLYLN